MGRGILYRYQYKMLINESALHGSGGELIFDDKDMILDDEFGPSGPVDELEIEDNWENLKQTIADAFDADLLVRKQWLDGNTHIFAEDNRVKLGISGGGEVPCLFALPNTYEHPLTHEETEYKIEKDVRRGFNQLIRWYPVRFWMFPLSSLHAGFYGKQHDGSFQLY